MGILLIFRLKKQKSIQVTTKIKKKGFILSAKINENIDPIMLIFIPKTDQKKSICQTSICSTQLRNNHKLAFKTQEFAKSIANIISSPPAFNSQIKSKN